MALRAGAAYVDILPKVAQGFDRQLEQELEAPASRSAGNVNKVLGAIGGAVIAKKTFDFLGGAVDAARESNRIAAQTEQVIKTTGGAANVSSRDVANLAGHISKLAGVDDEAVQSGENLLLTFTNVRNEVGRGNDIFNQATQITTDMSAALGQDMKSSAIQVGKALNDPIKGVTALQRVGVSFTQQQKDQIKTLVESGRTLDAQKLILGELNKEFGGAAQAGATNADRLNVTLGNLQESVGNALVPILDHLAGGLNVLVGAFAALPGPVQAGIVVLGGLAATFILIAKAQQAYRVAKEGLIVVEKAFAAVQTVVNAVMAANPIGLVVIALVALVAAFIVAYKNSETFRDIVKAAFGIVSDAIRSAIGFFEAIGRTVANVIGGAIDFLRRNWQAVIVGVLTGGLGLVVLAIANHFNDIVGFITGLPGRIAKAASGMWDGITRAFKSALNTIIRGWNGLEFKVPGFSVGPVHFGGFTLGVPDIPLLARGGTALAGGLAVVGDAGPELVNLPRGAQVIPLDRGGAAGAGVTIEHLEVHGQDTPVATARETVRRFKSATFLASARAIPVTP